MVLQNIVIAGAGIIGNSVAYYLARNYPHLDLSITVIDPVGICPAASAKAGGFLAKDWRDGSNVQELHRLGFDLHEQLSHELEGTDYRRLTALAVAVDGNLSRKHNSKKVPTTEWLDEDVVLGSMEMGTEDNIAQVHPKKLCDRMWEFSESRGVKLKIGKVVEAIMSPEEDSGSDDPEIRAVRLEDGSVIQCSVLVIATGPWTEEIYSWFPKTNHFEAALASLPPIHGVKSHSMLVKTERVLNQAVFFESNDSINDIEVYPRPDGDSYITGSSRTVLKMVERPGEEAVEPKLEEELLDAMRRTSSTVLGGREPHTIQACYWPETPDGVPVIGPLPNMRGVLIGTGHSVWGILQGPATGLVIAEFLAGESVSINLEPLGLGRGRMDFMTTMHGGQASFGGGSGGNFEDFYGMDEDGLVWE
mmetsp:Transcript_5089/g.10737  ORF Transcript_5089/g.10737 Transcript_5089/m.10737 type:complete len:419 (+) Transcript_5089:76-1332(+)